MTEEIDLTEVQRAGANAKARGDSLFDNPYLKPSALPLASGDSPADWEAKRLNWEIGYRAEELMRDKPLDLGPSISTNTRRD